MLHDLALEQGVLKPSEELNVVSATAKRKPLKYNLLKQPVCQKAYAALLGCSWAPRLGNLLGAVLEGRRSAPLDPRYLSRPNNDPTPVSAEVYTYLTSLYESVAETLPLQRDREHKQEIWSGDECELASQTRTVEEEETRYLPPGTMYDVYAQFIATASTKCSWYTFHRCWKQHFGKKLVFRDSYLFSVCPECTKHKLLIRHLAHDANQRLKQRQLYNSHLKQQLADRQVYWSLRASARLKMKSIVVILDGVDQAKFGIPRARMFGSKALDKHQRPRLHVWGALVHGRMALLTVSDGDLVKGSSTSIEILLFILTRLNNMGLDLSDYEITVQLDNTSSSNKNNPLMAMCGVLTLLRRVGLIRLAFLRVGHTHEDIDQWFGELIRPFTHDSQVCFFHFLVPKLCPLYIHPSPGTRHIPDLRESSQSRTSETAS